MNYFDYKQLTYVQAHCDSRVLHTPGNCKYCDLYPESQQQRIALGVAFTDEENTDKIPCPALLARPKLTIDSWGGNQPHRDNMPDEEIAYYDSVERLSSRVMYGDTVKRHKGESDPHGFGDMI